MNKGRKIRCFDYVNRPYDKVCEALRGNTLEVFSAATKAAATRAESVASTLHVNLGGFEVGADIAISVKNIEEEPAKARTGPVTHLQFEWEAAKSPRLFPFMQADLRVYPLTKSETQLDLAGNYDPPMGPLGTALDAIVGKRIAEASVHRFMKDVAEYLRTNLPRD